MKISYDKITDTLYIFTSDQENTVARDVGNGVLIKYSKKSNKPVGAIVHDFEKRLKIEQQPVEIPALI